MWEGKLVPPEIRLWYVPITNIPLTVGMICNLFLSRNKKQKMKRNCAMWDGPWLCTRLVHAICPLDHDREQRIEKGSLISPFNTCFNLSEKIHFRIAFQDSKNCTKQGEPMWYLMKLFIVLSVSAAGVVTLNRFQKSCQFYAKRVASNKLLQFSQKATQSCSLSRKYKYMLHSHIFQTLYLVDNSLCWGRKSESQSPRITGQCFTNI